MTQVSNLTNFIRQIKANGGSLKTVYDVGACRGIWTSQMKSSVLFDSDFFLFEANPQYEPHIKQLNNQLSFFYNIGVLSSPNTKFVDFYQSGDTGDSYYKETTAHYDNSIPTRLPCTTLDSIINQHNLPLPDFIKIDTQGSELDIFLGGEKALNNASLVYMECPIINYNSGAPRIGEYIAHMGSKDFIPVDVFEIHRSENVLLQIDIMFVKRSYHEKIFGKLDKIRV